jgi:signal peptidase II
VIDFIDLYAGDFHWPAFNLADSAITVGAVLVAVELFLRREPERSAP